MEEKAEYGCSLCVNTGDEHPDVFTSLSGIQPTRIEVKGTIETLKGGRTRTLTENYWELKPPVRVSDTKGDIWDLCQTIADITDILDRRESDVLFALQKFEHKRMVFYGNMYEYWVQFYADSEILHKMQKYNVPIKFSIMSFESEEDK